MRVAAAIVLGLAGTAAAYPMVLPVRSEARRAAIAQAFRARNREHWITVEVDARGFVTHAITDDPNLVPSPAWSPSDLERIRSFLRGNVELTGIGPRVIADIDQEGVLLFGRHGARLAKIDLERVAEPGKPPQLEIRAAFEIEGTPAVDRDDLTKTLAGTQVVEIDDYGKDDRTMFTRRRTVALREVDIRTTAVAHADGDRVRLVFCSEPKLTAAPADPAWGDVALVGQRFEPALIHVVDAITAERLTLSAKSCDALSNVRE
jgi:hypothetical protein